MTFDFPRVAAMAAVAAVIFHAAIASAAPVGVAKDVQGKMTLKRGGVTAVLKKGADIEQGDVIQAPDKTRVKIVFDDKTEFVVAGPGSLTVDKFIYDPNQSERNKAEFSILGAAFSYVSGKVGKTKNPDVTMNLDLGSIGIRGTKIYRSMNKGECWIYVERGKVHVRNSGGSVNLKSGQGTIMSARNKKPQDPHIWSVGDIAWMKEQVADPRLHKKDWR